MHRRGSDKQADFLPTCHIGSVALLSKESADQISLLLCIMGNRPLVLGAKERLEDVGVV